MVNEDVETYVSSLVDLTLNSKPLITFLAVLAQDYVAHAAEIVDVVEDRLAKVAADVKLPILYLIDCIVKNVGGPYKELFSRNIDDTFCNAFIMVDAKSRKEMFKLRKTWKKVFSSTKLYAMDVKINLSDPAWPVTAPTPQNSNQPHHIFPTTTVGATCSPELTAEVNVPIFNTDPIGLKIQQELIETQKGILELQRKKLELDILQTEFRLRYQISENSIGASAISPQVSDITPISHEESGTAAISKRRRSLDAELSMPNKRSRIEISDGYFGDEHVGSSLTADRPPTPISPIIRKAVKQQENESQLPENITETNSVDFRLNEVSSSGVISKKIIISRTDIDEGAIIEMKVPDIEEIIPYQEKLKAEDSINAHSNLSSCKVFQNVLQDSNLQHMKQSVEHALFFNEEYQQTPIDTKQDDDEEMAKTAEKLNELNYQDPSDYRDEKDDVVLIEETIEQICLDDYDDTIHREENTEPNPLASVRESSPRQVEPAEEIDDGFMDADEGLLILQNRGSISVKSEPIDNGYGMLENPFEDTQKEDEILSRGVEELEECKQPQLQSRFISSIDGNSEIDTHAPVEIKNVFDKIKINIHTPLHVVLKIINNKSETLECDTRPEFVIDPSQPLPPGEEPVLKSALLGIKLKEMPIVQKDGEFCSICSIM